MSVSVLLAGLLLSAVFAVAGLAKLADPAGSRQAMLDFGVPGAAARPLGSLLPVAEIAVAAALVVTPSARWGAAFALLLLGLFAVAIVVNLARGRRPECHCFGQLHSAPAGPATLTRNGVLMLVAGFVVWQGGQAASLDTSLAVGVIALAVAVAEGWFLVNLMAQQGRLLTRLESLEVSLNVATASGLAPGEPAPEFELATVSGGTVGLRSLLSHGRPLMLIFTDPECGPCRALLTDVARWRDQYSRTLSIAVISRGSPEAYRRQAGVLDLGEIALQRDREVAEAYGCVGTPSAVLVSADARIASSVAAGADRIAELVQRAAEALARASTEVEPDEARTFTQPAAIALPDLDGRTRAVAAGGDAATLVLFWSPACSFCEQMLEELKSWERSRAPWMPRLVVVSNGDVDVNRAMGFLSPVLLDADGTAARTCGVSRTPSAVLLDPGGQVASEIAVGAEEVMALTTRANATTVHDAKGGDGFAPKEQEHATMATTEIQVT